MSDPGGHCSIPDLYVLKAAWDDLWAQTRLKKRWIQTLRLGNPDRDKAYLTHLEHLASVQLAELDSRRHEISTAISVHYDLIDFGYKFWHSTHWDPLGNRFSWFFGAADGHLRFRDIEG